MRKKNRLYTANKWNQPLFADVDRTHQNIFDGEYSSYLQNPQQYAVSIPLNYQLNTPQTIQLKGVPSALDTYKNSSGNNWFGISKKNNPFSKVNIGTTMKGIGAGAATVGSQVNTGDPRGLYDTLDPMYHLAGGRESGVGNALSDTGVGLFKTGAQSGNGWLMLAGAGAKILGGLTNAAFGTKENKENVADIKQNTATARAAGSAFGNVTNENDFWTVAGNMGTQSDYTWRDLYKNGWLTKKGKKKGNALISDDNSAMSYQTHNMVRAADDIDAKMDEIAFANSYAFGGPLGSPMFGNTGMGAIDYGFMSDYLTARNRQAENKNTANNPFAGVANNFFSDGGSIHIKKSHEGLFTEKANRAGMEVQEYASHVLAHKENYPTSTVRQANFARNAKKFKHAYGGFLGDSKNIFDFGGDMQTNSADFSTGLTHISAGGSHEESPYDGVQLGVDSQGKPNLVEEGEVVWNDYVFSNRIPIDDETKKKFHFPKKRDITYAEAAKRLEKEISERANDPISEASFNAQMQQLEEQQERQKQEMEVARAREAFEALSPEEQAGIMQYAQQQQAQEQAMQQEAMVQQVQMQQPTPEEIAVAEQQGQPDIVEGQPVMAEGGHLYSDGGKKKNVGTWKDDKADHWGIFTKPGLRKFLENAREQIKMAPDDKKDEVRRKIMNDFNTLQQSYNDFVAPTLGSDKYEYSEGILNHQKDFDRKYGNTGFYSTDDNGNVVNLIADAINLPKGAATEDKPSNWYDGYNGPRTSIRNFGSTEYGNDDYYKDLVDSFRELGLTYAPNENWKYGPDGGYRLYGLSIPEAATVGETPKRRWDWQTGDWVNDTPNEVVGSPEVPSTATPGIASAQPKEDDWEVTPNYKADWLRYAGLFGPAVGLGMQALGIGKPDKGAFDNILESYDKSGSALADWKPIGNYVRYEPMDIWFEQNRLNANARATDRAILNSGSNQGSKEAALLASGFNNQVANGDLYRKALEYNDAKRYQTAGFNRDTDKFNAEAYNRAALQNAETLNRQRQYRARLGMQAAAQKADMDAGWYNGIYGNVAGLFKGIGDLGRENAQHNMIAEMAADGIFGNMSPRTNTGRRDKYLTWTKKAACGGKLNKKKGGK